MPGTRRPIAVVVALVVALTTACTVVDGPVASDQSTTVSPTTSIVGSASVPDPAPLDWHSCSDGLQCATLSVPLDYAQPDGRHIDLAVARRPATDQGARIGSLLLNPGGPGASGIDLLNQDPVPDAVAQRFDLVSWDPRGVGRSEGLRCGQDAASFYALDADPDTPAEQQALDDAGQALAQQCDSDPELLAHLDTGSTADDLEQIRRALGEDQISYLGYSYGTAIGLAYADRYPSRLRALVLDGVVDPDQTIEQLLSEQAVAMESTLAELAPLYDKLEAEAEQAPLPTSDGSTVGPAELALAVIATTYYPDGHGVLAQALTRADNGDARQVARLASVYVDAGSNFGSYVAISCVDSPHPDGAAGWQAMADRLKALAPRLGAPAANELVACAFWPVPPVGIPAEVSPAGLAPALVIGNTGDSATPLANAQRVAADLPGARLLTVDMAGHTATTSNRCAGDAVTRYLISGQLPDEGTICA